MVLDTVPVMWDPACFHSVWHKQIYEGIVKAATAAQCGVHLMVSPQEAFEYEKSVILIGFNHENLMDSIKRFSSQKMKIILAGMDSDSLGSQISCVTHSRSREIVRMIRYLYSCGKQRIAVVGSAENSLNDTVKVEAAKRYSADKPYPIRQKDIFQWRTSIDECVQAFLPRWKDYDAIICPNDYTAFDVIRQLVRNDVRIPEDLYVTGFSNQMIGRFCRPSITTVMMDHPLIGDYAFSVWQQLRSLSESDFVIKKYLPGKLIVRGSTAYQPNTAPEDQIILWDGAYEADQFYKNPTIQSLMKLDNCFQQLDELDLQLVQGILGSESYEKIADRLYISLGTLHYRMSKIYLSIGCRTRAEFTQIISKWYDHFEISDH